MLVVERVHPLRQLVYIIKRLVIKFPLSSSNHRHRSDYDLQGMEARSLNATPTTLALPLDAIFISSPRVVTQRFRRHQARLAVGTRRLHGFIIRAIHLLAILHKIVSGDSVDRRHTACIETSMTDGGNRWNIRNTGVSQEKPSLSSRLNPPSP